MVWRQLKNNYIILKNNYFILKNNYFILNDLEMSWNVEKRKKHW